MSDSPSTAEIERPQLDIARDGLSLTLYVSYQDEAGQPVGHPADAHPIARIILDQEPPDWSAVRGYLAVPGNHRSVWMEGLDETPGRLILPFDGAWMGKKTRHTYEALRGDRENPERTPLELRETDEGQRPYAYQPGDGTTHLVLDHFSGARYAAEVQQVIDRIKGRAENTGA